MNFARDGRTYSYTVYELLQCIGSAAACNYELQLHTRGRGHAVYILCRNGATCVYYTDSRPYHTDCPSFRLSAWRKALKIRPISLDRPPTTGAPATTHMCPEFREILKFRCTHKYWLRNIDGARVALIRFREIRRTNESGYHLALPQRARRTKGA
ncbi:hypothetical protein EVAR_83481_1 [Eumeta japonica]|uniref:Uncharacterized protein n=1 Tax=Eumeta variegata TaxID=151549 RepID=A0A4C1ZHJ3_EUMVA|nr:hypothetical protein EVAR_83481_1 [Eumeta japonica]